MDKFIGSTQESIPLFTLEEDIPMIASLIQQFCLAAKTTIYRYEIFSVNQLFLDLKNGGFKSAEEAKIQLNHDKYMYLNRIACQVSFFLSLSIGYTRYNCLFYQNMRPACTIREYIVELIFKISFALSHLMKE